MIDSQRVNSRKQTTNDRQFHIPFGHSNSPYDSESISVDSLENFLPPKRKPNCKDYIPFANVPLWNQFGEGSFYSIAENMFIDYIIDKYSETGVCAINGGIQFLYDKIRYNYYFPQEIDTCLSDSKINIIMMPLDFQSKENELHANMVIINKYFKTIEVFDPLGSAYHTYMDDIYGKTIKAILFNSSKILENEYTFLSYEQTCPGYGFQFIEALQKPLIQKIGTSLPFFSKYFKDLGGYCIFWTLFITELRIKYYNKSLLYIQNKYIEKYNKNPKKFYDFIRNYVGYLTSKLETDNLWYEYPHKNRGSKINATYVL